MTAAIMTYRPPLPHILLAMQAAGGLGTSHGSDLTPEDAQAIITEAGRFAADRIAPLNAVGDNTPARLVDGKVETSPGWRETYQDWWAGGWNSLTGPAAFDGQELPVLLAVACTELWNAASMAFALCPMLTAGAIEAISAHASPQLKEAYLPKLVSGEWTGTMNLTEPQSGSDLSTLHCKALRAGDGSYRITGNKIFITYGEHDCASNIVHLVLARLNDAPAGTRGISLFLVPKILPDGTPNDLRCQSLEHKLGIHGSPTCAMVFGDKGGATGWLVGEENRGLNCMFTMMNNARLMVGVQGVAMAERATQAALAYAAERKQGRAPGQTEGSTPIIAHPDVKRMLLEMRAKTSAARMLCMATAAALDASTHAGTEEARRQAHARASLLTPLAKAYATDIAVEVSSAAVQVHGGMGYMEQTGVAQYYRDARILPIYEGTNGIQAIDLVTRKLLLENGATLAETLKRSCSSLAGLTGEAAAGHMLSVQQAMAGTLSALPSAETSLAVATPFLRALAAFIAAGFMADAATCAKGGPLHDEAEANARYYAAVELPSAMAAAQGALAAAATIAGATF